MTQQILEKHYSDIINNNKDKFFIKLKKDVVIKFVIRLYDLYSDTGIRKLYYDGNIYIKDDKLNISPVGKKKYKTKKIVKKILMDIYKITHKYEPDTLLNEMLGKFLSEDIEYIQLKEVLLMEENINNYLIELL